MKTTVEAITPVSEMIADPDAIDNVADLREALKRANKNIQAQHELVVSIGGQLAVIVLAYITGDPQTVIAELGRIAKENVQIIATESDREGMH